MTWHRQIKTTVWYTATQCRCLSKVGPPLQMVGQPWPDIDRYRQLYDTQRLNADFCLRLGLRCRWWRGINLLWVDNSIILFCRKKTDSNLKALKQCYTYKPSIWNHSKYNYWFAFCHDVLLSVRGPPLHLRFWRLKSVNPFNPEFTTVIFIHYKPRIAAAILDL